MTGVELELFTDYEMHLFMERGMNRGISMVSKHFARANNPAVEGYDSSKPKSHILYLDANNLCGWAMSKLLPQCNFKWKQSFPSEEEILEEKENDKKGWILEVDLDYPSWLHEEHNSYPLAPENKAVDESQLSGLPKKPTG